jgi:glycine/D-amino acid oxidase-like deaminating enzyme
MERSDWDAIVVGGGFFGSSLAIELAQRVERVVLLEREDDLLRRASYRNQARVHAGYHYPRSLMTAVRSRINFPRFIEDFSESIRADFEKYYAVSRRFSNVTARQFAHFMRRAGAPLSRAPDRVRRMFNSDLVEEVFATHEVAFDAEALRMTMRRRLADASIPIEFGVSANRIRRAANGSSLQVECSSKGQNFSLRASWVFNCTYSRINQLTVASNLEPVTLKHELTELALVEMPPSLCGISVTVMCGPFFSTMPFPARGLWTLSHVRYTPHCSWTDSRSERYCDAYLRLEGFRKSSSFPYMVNDASRYLPALKDCVYRDSLWEVKTTLPQSELDDGRPILFQQHPQLHRLVTVMGGKLDNIYDIPQDLDLIGLNRRATV